MSKNNEHQNNSSLLQWIDVSVPLCDNIRQSPGEPLKSHIERIRARERGDKITMHQLFINSHNGTHIDAPFEWIEGSPTIDQMPLDTTIGPARVIEIKDMESIKIREIQEYDIQPGERILFKTRNSQRIDYTTKFDTNNVYFTYEAIRFLVERRVRVVGLDAISIGNMQTHELVTENHLALLSNGIYIIEDIDLSKVSPGQYYMIGLPIRLQGGDAAPARLILRPLD